MTWKLTQSLADGKGNLLAGNKARAIRGSDLLGGRFEPALREIAPGLSFISGQSFESHL